MHMLLYLKYQYRMYIVFTSAYEHFMEQYAVYTYLYLEI